MTRLQQHCGTHNTNSPTYVGEYHKFRNGMHHVDTSTLPPNSSNQQSYGALSHGWVRESTLRSGEVFDGRCTISVIPSVSPSFKLPVRRELSLCYLLSLRDTGQRLVRNIGSRPARHAILHYSVWRRTAAKSCCC